MPTVSEKITAKAVAAGLPDVRVCSMRVHRHVVYTVFHGDKAIGNYRNKERALESIADDVREYLRTGKDIMTRTGEEIRAFRLEVEAMERRVNGVCNALVAAWSQKLESE